MSQLRRIFEKLLPGMEMVWQGSAYALMPPPGCVWTMELAMCVLHEILPALPLSRHAGLTSTPLGSEVFKNPKAPASPIVIITKTDNLFTQARQPHGPAILCHMPDNPLGATWLASKLEAPPFDAQVPLPRPPPPPIDPHTCIVHTETSLEPSQHPSHACIGVQLGQHLRQRRCGVLVHGVGWHQRPSRAR